VDLGVGTAKDLAGLLRGLGSRGAVTVLERTEGTVHLRFDGVDVSIFVLPSIRGHTDQITLTVDGVLATKLHAILDRGMRRDFFDLYVMLQQERVGVVDCIRALREVYSTEVNEGLLLRALSFFDDAEREAALPGEGARDWEQVKAFFVAAAGALIVPPTKRLEVQRHVVDVRRAKPKPKSKRSSK
jgi:hypothetical protein